MLQRNRCITTNETDVEPQVCSFDIGITMAQRVYRRIVNPRSCFLRRTLKRTNLARLVIYQPYDIHVVLKNKNKFFYGFYYALQVQKETQ